MATEPDDMLANVNRALEEGPWLPEETKEEIRQIIRDYQKKAEVDRASSNHPLANP